MRPLTIGTMLAVALVLSGCAGMLEGPAALPDQEVTVGSYRPSAYPAYGTSDYYSRPTYVAPYASLPTSHPMHMRRPGGKDAIDGVTASGGSTRNAHFKTGSR
jgi:hypothetical protein